MQNKKEQSRRDVRLVMGGRKASTEILLGSGVKSAKSSNMLMSIRKVIQKPDISSIQLLSWLSSKRKENAKASRKNGREWSRFMAGYLGSNANLNDVK